MSTLQQSVNYTTTIPQVSGLPVLGVLPQLLGSDPFEYLKNIMLKYGEFVALKFGPLTVYLVSNPDYLQYILRDNNQNFEKPEMLYRVMRKFIGNGLVTSSGDFWLRQRRMIQPHLHRKQLPLLYNNMVSAITSMLDSWELRAANGEVFDLQIEMSQITMEVILRTMFGTDMCSEQEMKTVSEMMPILVGYIGQNGFFGFLPEWMPFPGDKRFEYAYKTVHEIVSRLIARCREHGDKASGLIKMLLNTVDEATNEQMTDQQLFDEAMTIFAAGFETTASVLSWLWVVLDRHPEVAAKLKTEVDSVVGDRVPEFEDLTKLEYGRKVFLELMRFYTIGPMLPRRAKEDTSFGDYRVPAKSFVLMFFHGVHHNPRCWDEPERFDPERFSEEQVSQRHPFAYLPFSGGPRKCAGDDFALMEGPLAIAMILQRYSVELLPGQDFSHRMAVTMRPHNGVKARMKVRAKGN